jgi:amino acid transporter
MADDQPPSPPPPGPDEEREPLPLRVKHFVIGKPRDLTDKRVFHHLALIPLLAWVGLGADALSSSAYGPEESFRALHEHTYLAVLLAVATALTVTVISTAYSKLIEHFPNGGGYGVASRLLGERAGLVSGCALLIDYVLTITISIAAAGDAVFSFLPHGWNHPALPWFEQPKVWFEAFLVVGLTVLNLRGVKESILVLAPMFGVFLVTHAVLLVAGIVQHAPEVDDTMRRVGNGFREGYHDPGLGFWGMALLFFRAYSLGGGTYTGIEAVSNALPLMREPRVQTAKRTMLYLAVSLALTAGGLLLCYLLWEVGHTPGRTMNAVLAEQVFAGWPLGRAFVVTLLASEAALLIVAAQAGFVGGPRVTANMAVDSWLPHGFASLSERLTTGNGVVIMGATSLIVLLAMKGNVSQIVVMYSINVFLTFSLTMAGMVVFWWFHQRARPPRERRARLALFGFALVLCATILAVTVVSKFGEGAWKTLCATGALVGVCVLVRRHYRTVTRKAAALYSQFGDLPLSDQPPKPIDRTRPTAIILVGGYGALGIHTLLNVQRVFPGHFGNAVFVSVGVMDSGGNKGVDTIDALRGRTEESLSKYVRLATALGLPAASHYAVGTDAVAEAEELCLAIAKDYPRSVFFAGKLIFQNERWYHRLLHNNTAHAVQKRLHWAGRAMVIMPARMR